MAFSYSTISLSDANNFIEKHHRHLKTRVWHKYSLACYENGRLCGVIIVGRPRAQKLQDGFTLEIVRNCTDGTRNACSFLYGAAIRAGKALGYKKIITYTLIEECGASLRAANFKNIGLCGGGSWNRRNRPRIDKHNTGKKYRWEILL